MAIFEWKPEYSVNIKIIDDQHKQLIGTINILYEAMQEGKGRDVLVEVFDRLAEYTTIHFSTEENYMVMYSYPDYILHKKEHHFCIAKVSEFKKKFDEGSINLTVELFTFLVDWLHKHLITMDQKYSKFFNEKGLL